MRCHYLLVLVLLGACGDDGATSLPDAAVDPIDATTDAQPIDAPGAVMVTISSPAEGAVVLGARTITVSGTLAAEAAITGVEVVTGSTTTTATFTQTTFSATLALADETNSVVVTARAAGGGVGTATASVRYPFVAFTTFAPASFALGQSVLTVGASRTTDATTTGNPVGNPALIGGRLYVPALGEHRVLGFDAVPTAAPATASFALGQASLTGATPAVGAAAMNQASGVAAAANAFFVVDHANNRVVGYTTAPATTGVAADFALGQPNLVDRTSTCAAAGLNGPHDAIVAGGKLIIPDTNNHRVLIWNTIPTTTGAPADVVLGQADFTRCVRNDDNQDGVADATPTARTIRSPIGAWSDGTRLIVADSSNHRLLLWNTIPTVSFTPADVVLGQPDFVSATAGTTATGLNSPQFLASNGNQLAVTDTNNHRVLIWDTIPTAAIAPDRLLGQSAFTRGTANDDDQNGTSDGAPTGRTFSAPRGLLFLPGRLLVSDLQNHRVLVFAP